MRLAASPFLNLSATEGLTSFSEHLRNMKYILFLPACVFISLLFSSVHRSLSLSFGPTTCTMFQGILYLRYSGDGSWTQFSFNSTHWSEVSGVFYNRQYVPRFHKLIPPNKKIITFESQPLVKNYVLRIHQIGLCSLTLLCLVLPSIGFYRMIKIKNSGT